MTTESRRDDYDGPWKAVLEEYLPDFLALCFPEVYVAIDWRHVPIFLEQELQQIAPDEPTGRQHVDKLIRVMLHDGSNTWMLIHTEVQNQYDGDFAERMFRYNTRIYDRYRQQVVSLAVLGDDRPHWQPHQFGYSRLGCSVQLRFLTVKLIAFDRQQLDQTPGVMAAFVLAHLDALDTHGNPHARLARRIDRYRRVLTRGYPAEQIRSLVHFFDWLLRLPPALAQEAHAALRATEEELQMNYITSHEEIGIQKGRAEGLHAGIVLALEIKFGPEASHLTPAIEQIVDLPTLEQLMQTIRTASSLHDIEAVLAPPPA